MTSNERIAGLGVNHLYRIAIYDPPKDLATRTYPVKRCAIIPESSDPRLCNTTGGQCSPKESALLMRYI